MHQLFSCYWRCQHRYYVSLTGELYVNPRIENLLQISADTSEDIRQQVPDMDAGFDDSDRTWEIIVKTAGSLDRIRNIYTNAEFTQLLCGYWIVRTTIDSIEYRYKNRLDERFGNLDIESITIDMVREYQKEMLYQDNLSAEYINRIIGIMRQILDCGVTRNLVKENVLVKIKKVKDQYRIDKKQVIWDLDVFRTFDSYIADDMDKLLFNMLYFLGLRKGELLSLKWSNINFEKKIVNVISTAVQIVGKGQIVTTPKTNHSIRGICMNDTLFEMLSNYYFKMKLQYDVVNHLYIFGSNKMISFSALDRKLAKYLKLSGVEKINLHGFRHSHATMLASLTTDIKSISDRLGHESVDVTLNEYIHSNDFAQKELADLIENEVIQNDNTLGFENFTSYLENILLKEITKDSYKESEIKHMINIYNYVKKQEFNY